LGDETSIEWADRTINFAMGCTKVSSGCDNCYAERNLKRFGKPWKFTPTNIDNVIEKLNQWPPSIIFTNSMSDTFHEDADDEFVDREFEVMGAYSKHQFVVLTKRIGRAYNWFKNRYVPLNCWIGTSIEDKAHLFRMETLKKITANVRFVSFEPLLEGLGKINLDGIHWAIVGGESDFKAPRHFDIEWAREIRDQCINSNTAFFFKQTGGKKKIDGCWGTNILDGRKYLEMPFKLQTKESISERDILQKELLLD